MRVKGTWVVNFVKVIRANKDKNFKKWLTDEDWAIIDAHILPSSWYSYESFLRMGHAIYKEVAGSDRDMTRLFGRLMMTDHLKIYKTIRVDGDPAASVTKFTNLKKSFFGDIDSFMEVTDQGPNYTSCKLSMTARDMARETSDAFSFLLAGNLEELVEQAGGKNVETVTKREQRGYQTQVKWE